MSLTFWVWVHLSFVLLTGAMLLRLGHGLALPDKGLAAAILLFAGFALVPYQGVSLAGWLLALSGMLSMGSLMVLALPILSRLGMDTGIGQHQRQGFWPIVFLLGLVLYPTALGLGTHDSYAWGYGRLMAWVCLGLSPLFWLIGQRLIGLWLSLSVLAWTLRLGESANLWDYLLDPWLFVASVLWLPMWLFTKRPEQVGEEGP